MAKEKGLNDNTMAKRKSTKRQHNGQRKRTKGQHNGQRKRTKGQHNGQRKRTKGQTMIYKTLHRKLKLKQHEPTKSRGELMCSGMASSSCSTCNTRRVTFKQLFHC